MMADEYYDGAYTGEEIDAAVAAAFAAAPQSTTYNKAEVDSALSGKADASHTHTRSQITDLGAAAAKGFDAAPTSGNTNNAVSSDGVYQALQAMAKTATVVHEHTAAGDYEEAFIINIPPGKTMQIMAGCAWSNSQCTGVKILYGGNKIIAVNEPSTSQSVVCASGCKRNGGSGQMAVSVLVRYAGATANEVYIVYTIV